MPKNITHEQQTPEQNYILAALSGAERDRLLKYLEPVSLELGNVIYGPNQHISYAYFPTTSIISLQYIMHTGACAEAAEVGNDSGIGGQYARRTPRKHYGSSERFTTFRLQSPIPGGQKEMAAPP